MSRKNKINMLSGLTKKLLIFIFLSMFMLSIAYAGQSPGKLDVPVKAGEGFGTFSLVTSDLIGDHGDHASPSPADMDADGDLDLMVGYSDGIIRYFRNDNNSFTLVDSDVIGDTGDYVSPELIDFDKDGDFDIITETETHVTYYENIGTQEDYDFIKLRDIFGRTESYEGVSLADMDADGDYDMVTTDSDSDGRRVRYYENIVSEYGIDFEKKERSWLGNNQNYISCHFLDYDYDGDSDVVCVDNGGQFRSFENIGNSTYHIWKPLPKNSYYFLDLADYVTPTFIDFDFDGDYDMYVGNVDGSVDYYDNSYDVTGNYFDFTLTNTNVVGDAGSYAAPALYDVDGDGDLDMYVGNDDGDNIKHYQNNNGTFSYVGIVPVLSGLGTRPHPIFKDMNQDGLVDLMISNDYAQVNFYNNTGTNTSFSWEFISTPVDLSDNWFGCDFQDLNGDTYHDMICGWDSGWSKVYYNNGNASSMEFYFEDPHAYNFYSHSTPSLVDFNYDGNVDLFLGADDGIIRYYVNENNNTHPDFVFYTAITDIGSRSDPQVIDLNHDGDLDIIAGKYENRYQVYYYENIANEMSYNWSEQTNLLFNHSAVHKVMDADDWDGDGDYDLVVGTSDGYVRYFENNGTVNNPSYVLNTDIVNFDVGSHATPEAADMDNDGDLDLIIGEYDSNFRVNYFRNDGDNSNTSWVHVTEYMLSDPGGERHYHTVPEIVDYDDDGDFDIVLASRRQYYDYDNYVDYFRNDGSPETYSFVYVNQIYHTSTQHTYFGYNNYPIPRIVDLNYDGIKDLVIGNQHGSTNYYLDIEDDDEPDANRFVHAYFGDEQKTSGYAHQNWAPDVGGHSAPEFVDLDNDGDLDMLSGTSGINIFYFKNEGLFNTTEDLAKYPCYTHMTSYLLPWPGNERHYWTSPELVDVDDDGDYDAYVGSRREYYNYNNYVDFFRNDGSPTNANFVYVSNPIHYNTKDSPEYHATHLKPEMIDIDQNGVLDMLIGNHISGMRLSINEGTNDAQIFRTPAAGENGYFYGLSNHDSWNYFAPDSYDFDDDGDMDLFVCRGNGYCTFHENKGIYDTEKEKAENAIYMHRSSDLIGYVVTSDAYWYKPKLGDLDGDGDYDMVIGIDERAGTDEGIVYTYENTGGKENPYSWQSRNQILRSSSYRYPDPHFGDMDGDNNLDIFIGISDGRVFYYNNTITNTNTTSVLIMNGSKAIVSGVTVKCYNDTELVHTSTTNAKGKVSCNLDLVEEGRIVIENGPSSGYIQIGHTSSSSLGKTSMILESNSQDYEVTLKHIEMYVSGPKNDGGNGIHIRLSDYGQDALVGHTDSNGYFDGFLPERYLVNKREQYTQNRITYDLDVFPSLKYGSHLRISDIYMPNKINLSSADDSKKLFKFPSAKKMATDAVYKGYLIYPAVNSQKEFQFTEKINDSFSLGGDVVVKVGSDENLRECTFTGSGTEFDIDSTIAGCEMLDLEVSTPGDGDWVLIEYPLAAPDLNLFLVNGWGSRNFTFKPADLTLKS
ncbi:VCBS repeat-containing protein [Candidatus Woesearchaeota archaeon]|nr:VCBS repeat-containing protein [Candidatus Woesearchaeota archaeon]